MLGIIAALLVVVTLGLLPGFSFVHLTVLLGGLSFFLSPTDLMYAWVVGGFLYFALDSAKQAQEGSLSGDSSTLLCSAPALPVGKIYSVKLIGLVIGGLVGLLLSFVLGDSIPQLAPIVALIFIGVATFTRSGDWVTVIVFLLGIKFLFFLCTKFGISNPVFVIGSAVMAIPIVGRGFYQMDEVVNDPMASNELNPFIGVMAGFISFITPGVSPLAVISSLESRAGGASTLLTALCVEVGIETCALFLSLSGVVSGKAIVTAEVGHLVTPFAFICGIGAFLFGGVILSTFHRHYVAVLSGNPRGWYFFSLVLNLGVLIATAGLVKGLLFLGIGGCLQAFLMLRNAPKVCMSVAYSGAMI